VWVIAHRGASAEAPENTLAAFRRAAEMGAGFVELDLQLTRDSRLVVLHDAVLDHTTNGSGLAMAKTLAEVRQLDAGSWFDGRAGAGTGGTFAGERIPVLEEVFAFARESDVGLYLELKSGILTNAAQTLVAALRSSGEIGGSVVISFDTEVLAQIRRIEPLIVTGFLYDEAPADPVAEALFAGARQLLPQADLVTPELVRRAHAGDLKVATWAVDAPEQMRELMAAGVDGIMTNRPNVLLEVLAGAKR
jgi:glycerophosphoryl diester phosphodiesterase